MESTTATSQAVSPTTKGRTWLELEVLLLVLLCLGVYFVRLTALSIRGEESRWAQVAHEMLSSGDWVVPRQRGATATPTARR